MKNLKKSFINLTLEKNFPNVKIIGEEGNSVTMTSFCSEVENLSQNLNLDYDLSKLTAWIDPLDGTAELVDGNYENITGKL